MKGLINHNDIAKVLVSEEQIKEHSIKLLEMVDITKDLVEESFHPLQIKIQARSR